MAVNREKRKMPVGLVKIHEFNKENLKTCGLQLICHVTEEFKKEQNKLRTHVNEILHSIFFLGIIHKDSLTPEDILSAKMSEIVRREFPEPFKKYKSHLPKRTPFSILLEIDRNPLYPFLPSQPALGFHELNYDNQIPDRIKEEFLSFVKGDAVDLSGIANFVERVRDSTIPLVKPKGSTLRICGQDGTVYGGDEEQLEAWKDYYLPERTEMEVIGAIDDFPCDAFGLQLVLLLGEDGRVFAYEDELLHLVAMNLRDLFRCEMVFPGMETFKLGECFEEPTEEEYHEMMESDEVKEMKKEHMEFRQCLEDGLLKTMNDITRSRNVHKQKQVGSEDFTSSTKQRIQGHSSICNSKVENGDKLQSPYRHFHQSRRGLIVSS